MQSVKRRLVGDVNEAWMHEIPEAPAFHPSLEEFQDPMNYISKIGPEASKFGICRIVPPLHAATAPALVLNPPGSPLPIFDTRQQWIRKQEWHSFNSEQFYDGRHYTLPQYEEMANSFQQQFFGARSTLSPRMVEEAYWLTFYSGDGVTVEYGNDVEGTAFARPDSSDPLASSPWNLQVLPTLPASTLRSATVNIPGVTSPMIYVGMLFSTFAWHVEDQYLYSINYQHFGASKTWYGVPASAAEAFEEVAEKKVYRRAGKLAARRGQSAAEIKDSALRALIRKTTMFSPDLLLAAGVPVCRAVQNPGEFVVTFPKSYHGGFSNGFCVGEAANFAIGNWFRFGLEACQRYRRLKHPIMLSQEHLLCIEAEALGGMSPEERGVHVTNPAGREFVSLMAQCLEDIKRLADAGAVVQVEEVCPPFRPPCDTCGYPCHLAHVLLSFNGLICCFQCALLRPNYLKAARIMCHNQFARFQRLADKLAYEAQTGRAAETVLQLVKMAKADKLAKGKEMHANLSPSASDCTTVNEILRLKPDGNSPIPEAETCPFQIAIPSLCPDMGLLQMPTTDGHVQGCPANSLTEDAGHVDQVDVRDSSSDHDVGNQGAKKDALVGPDWSQSVSRAKKRCSSKIGSRRRAAGSKGTKEERSKRQYSHVRERENLLSEHPLNAGSRACEDVDWVSALDLSRTELARAASTRSSNCLIVALRHAKSWQKRKTSSKSRMAM